MRFEDQIALYSRARGRGRDFRLRPPQQSLHAAGRDDHRTRRPRGTKGKRSPTQVLCDTVAGVRNALIPFAGWKFDGYRVMLFDMAALQSGLDAILGQETAPAPTARPPSLLDRLWQAFEVGYRVLRPMAGTLARKTLNGLGLRK